MLATESTLLFDVLASADHPVAAHALAVKLKTTWSIPIAID
jgi:hypothetical protein